MIVLCLAARPSFVFFANLDPCAWGPLLCVGFSLGPASRVGLSPPLTSCVSASATMFPFFPAFRGGPKSKPPMGGGDDDDCFPCCCWQGQGQTRAAKAGTWARSGKDPAPESPLSRRGPNWERGSWRSPRRAGERVGRAPKTQGRAAGPGGGSPKLPPGSPASTRGTDFPVPLEARGDATGNTYLTQACTYIAILGTQDRGRANARAGRRLLRRPALRSSTRGGGGHCPLDHHSSLCPPGGGEHKSPYPSGILYTGADDGPARCGWQGGAGKRTFLR